VIKIKGDLGSKTYISTLADPTHLYRGATLIPGAVVTRTGGWPAQGDAVVIVEIPRDGVYWGLCCDLIQWRYEVYHASLPANFQLAPGWFESPCIGDFYPAEVKKFIEVYKYVEYPGEYTDENR
jgi:hypothetical protein